jgi:hypothetical protein
MRAEFKIKKGTLIQWDAVKSALENPVLNAQNVDTEVARIWLVATPLSTHPLLRGTPWSSVYGYMCTCLQ